jgi:hypothetical protein
MAIMVLVQYALGMWVNLFVTIPSADHRAGLFTAIGQALAYGPAMLATHATVGLLILLGTIGMTYHAVTLRRPSIIAAAFIALLAVVSAIGGGAGFVGTQQDSGSYDMAISAGVALACFLVILYLTGKPQTVGGKE